MNRSITGVSFLLGGVLFAGALYLIPSGLGPSRADYYSLYGEALRQGRLWVALFPCPYDTIAFNGKCYVHWGVVPALFHWFSLWSDRLGSILGAVVLTFYLLKTLMRLSGESANETLAPFALFIAFGTGIFTTALCGWVYGESVCLAHAFGMMGVYYALPMLTQTGGRARPLLAGTAIALACLTRPSWFLFALFSLVWAFRKRVFLYLVPVSVGFLIQAVLNAVRFSNPFEFGVKYYTGHLTGAADIRWSEGIYSLKAVLPNLATYFFTGAPLVPVSAPGGQVFRYFDLTQVFHGTLYHEFPLALFVTMPVLLVGIFQFRALRKLFQQSWKLLLCLLPMSLLLLCNTNQIYRYQFEVWLPVLLLLLPVLLINTRPWVSATAWLSAGVCVVVTAINTYWVVISRWGML